MAVRKGKGTQQKEDHKGKAQGRAYSNSLQGKGKTNRSVATTYELHANSSIILAESQHRQKGFSAGDPPEAIRGGGPAHHKALLHRVKRVVVHAHVSRPGCHHLHHTCRRSVSSVRPYPGFVVHDRYARYDSWLQLKDGRNSYYK